MKKIMLKVEDNKITDFYYEDQQEYETRLVGYDLYSFDETKVSINNIEVGLALDEMSAKLVEE